MPSRSQSPLLLVIFGGRYDLQKQTKRPPPPFQLSPNTNMSYKIFASMLQHKLQHHLDSKVRDRQFGFRKNRSTTQPIHIIRRLLEVFERQSSPFHALFIDWSKAFDSVTFTAIDAAMNHMGVPPHTRKVTMALYANPAFVVRDSSQKSTIGTQTKGFRQGCPLSPIYLVSSLLTYFTTWSRIINLSLAKFQEYFMFPLLFGTWSTRMTLSYHRAQQSK